MAIRRFLRFGGLVANGDPIIDNPTENGWFNTAAFARLPNYTPRSNPWQYPGLTAPGLLNVDASLVKNFNLTEKVRFQLRADSFNMLNNITWADPSTDINSSTFGRSINQLSNTMAAARSLDSE